MREMGIGPDDPRLNGVAEERNMVSEMDVDIIMEETPDIPTIQQEQFSEIAALAAGGVPIPPDLLIEASSLRNKKALLEKMRGGGEDPEAAQAAAEKVAQVEAMQLDEMKAKIEKIRSETLENIAQAAKAKSQATAPK
jgi:Tat protein secretion system quality control protein TatD with DNase activity